MANPSDQATQDRNPIEDIVWYATHSVVNPAVLRDMIYTAFDGVLFKVGPDEDGNLPK